MLKKLREKLSLLTDKSIVRNIDGQDFKFYPVSLLLFYELRTTLEPLFAAVQSLFEAKDNSSDGKRTIHQETRPDKTVETVTMMEPPSLEMIRFRQARADEKSKAALGVILGDESRRALARVLANSLRNGSEQMDDDEAVQFFNELDIPTALQFLNAFMDVNAKVLSPLVRRAVEALKARLMPVESESPKGPQGVVDPSGEQS